MPLRELLGSSCRLSGLPSIPQPRKERACQSPEEATARFALSSRAPPSVEGYGRRPGEGSRSSIGLPEPYASRPNCGRTGSKKRAARTGEPREPREREKHKGMCRLHRRRRCWRSRDKNNAGLVAPFFGRLARAQPGDEASIFHHLRIEPRPEPVPVRARIRKRGRDIRKERAK